MTLKTKLAVQLDASLTSALDLASAVSDIGKGWQFNLASGTTSGKADVLWHDERTLAASGTEDLDLAGTLTGLLGGTVTFAKVKGVLVYADDGNTNDVVIGGASANGWLGPFGDATDTVAVKPGGLLVMMAPGTAGLGSVTAATADLLHVANGSSGSGVTYQIIIVGTSA